jgi:hypothetical protein
MVARIGHNWDSAGEASRVSPIVQTMVVVHKIADIQDYDEYDALRENRPVSERVLLQGFQETNNRGAKAFRDRMRELIMPFFVKGDGTKQQDEKFIHALQSTFGITGSTILHHHHPEGHPMLLDCMDTAPPTEKGERRRPRALAAARARPRAHSPPRARVAARGNSTELKGWVGGSPPIEGTRLADLSWKHPFTQLNFFH